MKSSIYKISWLLVLIVSCNSPKEKENGKESVAVDLTALEIEHLEPNVSDSNVIPQLVKDSFKKDFFEPANETWDKSGMEFTVNFYNDDKKIKAHYDASGKLISTEFELNIDSLPDDILVYYGTQYPYYEVYAYSKIVSKETTYQVNLSRDIEGESYDAELTFNDQYELIDKQFDTIDVQEEY